MTRSKDELRRHRARAKQEVRRLVKNEIPRQLSTMSELLGRPVAGKDLRKYRATARKKIERWIDTVFDIFTGWDSVDADEMRKRLAVFFDKAFRLFGRVPRRKHALSWYRKQIENALTVPGHSAFATSYNQYSRATGWLVRQLFKTERVQIARDFFSAFVKSAEGFSLAQIYVQQVLPGYRSLDRLQGKSLETRDVRKLVGLYLLYSGVYEKMARLLVLINRIRKGEIAGYEMVRTTPMARIEEEIERETRLRVLLKGFNRQIRNSIAHPSYTILSSMRTVKFHGDRPLEISWNQLRIETAKLSTLVFSISLTPFLHSFRTVLLGIERMLSGWHR